MTHSAREIGAQLMSARFELPKGLPEGPWHVVPEDDAIHRWVIGDADGGSIAECAPVGPWMSDEQADAVARAIAAIPEMIAEIERSRKASDRCDWETSHLAKEVDRLRAENERLKAMTNRDAKEGE